MEYTTDPQKVARTAAGDELVAHVVDAIARFTDGEDVTLDFLGHQAIGDFGAALGIERNWAELELDEIAPPAAEGPNVVPQDEAAAILSALQYLLQKNLLSPEADGTPAPHLLNDFLPEGTRFKDRKCLGHLWEFGYALGVELEHGITRGTNVTQNHPLLTGLVVLAHLAEDTLYYARLWVMETEGELLNAQLGDDHAAVMEALETLQLAQKHLAARIDEKIALAKRGSLPDQAA